MEFFIKILLEINIQLWNELLKISLVGEEWLCSFSHFGW